MRRLALGLAVALVAVAAWVMLAPDDPAVWHADPLAGARTGRPNDHHLAPDGRVFAETPQALMARFDAIAMAAPRVTRLAGDPAQLWVTYVQRSRLFRFPDYISVKAVPVSGGASLAIWSRARYGYSDLGVNKARIDDWLSRL